MLSNWQAALLVLFHTHCADAVTVTAAPLYVESSTAKKKDQFQPVSEVRSAPSSLKASEDSLLPTSHPKEQEPIKTVSSEIQKSEPKQPELKVENQGKKKRHLSAKSWQPKLKNCKVLKKE